MDLEKIRTCCESLEQDITELRMTDKIEYYFYSAMIDAVQEIAAEISEPPKSNADRIRQMTDEELFVFLNEITDCCFSNNDCDNCPMKYSDDLYYRCNIEAWLKQEVETDDKR